MRMIFDHPRHLDHSPALQSDDDAKMDQGAIRMADEIATEYDIAIRRVSSRNHPPFPSNDIPQLFFDRVLTSH
jgi:hypothetical protein